MKNIALVMGSFHTDLVEEMRQEAHKTAEGLGLKVHAEIWVPGSVEKPLAAQQLLKRSDIDAVVLLGIIEKGGTKHGFTMGQSLMHFTMQLSLDYSKPVTLGVLGPDIDPDQIAPRTMPYARAAVVAAAKMLEQDYKA